MLIMSNSIRNHQLNWIVLFNKSQDPSQKFPNFYVLIGSAGCDKDVGWLVQAGYATSANHPRYEDAAPALPLYPNALHTYLHYGLHCSCAPPELTQVKVLAARASCYSIANTHTASFLFQLQRDKMAFLILVIGDLHIPDRALDIPAKVRSSARCFQGRAHR